MRWSPWVKLVAVRKQRGRLQDIEEHGTAEDTTAKGVKQNHFYLKNMSGREIYLVNMWMMRDFYCRNCIDGQPWPILSYRCVFVTFR